MAQEMICYVPVSYQVQLDTERVAIMPLEKGALAKMLNPRLGLREPRDHITRDKNGEMASNDF